MVMGGLHEDGIYGDGSDAWVSHEDGLVMEIFLWVLDVVVMAAVENLR